MARITVGLTPVQVAPPNPRRFQLSAQLMPLSIIAGNTGKVYGKFGSPPTASDTSNSWDFVLNAGAADGTNLYESQDVAADMQELWLVSDTADQIVNVVERSIAASPRQSEANAA